MYPFIQLAITLYRARRRPPIEVEECSELQLRAGITDIDMFMELNHGRYFTCMELGRWDHAQRVGFVVLMKKKKWGISVGGASIRFRRRIPAFSKFTLSTQLLCHDGRWFYFLQETRQQGKICSSALVKAGAVSKTGLVTAVDVCREMGREGWGEEMPGWVSSWIKAEGERPWPSE